MVRTITPIEPKEIQVDKIKDPDVAAIVAAHIQDAEPIEAEQIEPEAVEPEHTQVSDADATMLIAAHSGPTQNKEIEKMRQELQEMRAGIYQSAMKLKMDQYTQLQKELNDTANDISSTEKLVMELQDEIKKLEEWLDNKGHYEGFEFRFNRYRSVLVNLVVPSLKGLLNDFGGVRKNLEIINKLIQKKGGEMEE